MESKTTTMEEQRTERETLRLASYNSYSEDDFPGSRRYMLHQGAVRALAAYDAAHPELVAILKAERDAARKAKYDGMSDFAKRGG